MKEVYQQQQQHQQNPYHQNTNGINNNNNYHQQQQSQSNRVQRKKELECIIRNPKSLISVDGLLDGITALVLDCEPMKKNKNIDNFLSRCK